jgi:curved DNA-binding protein
VGWPDGEKLSLRGDNVDIPDYYEFLQISPNAEQETIQRVYRFMAIRLHPDNPQTGDPEKFFLLKQAYDVLSDPARRAEYNAVYRQDVPRQAPMSTTIDFMDSIEGEINRRLALLAVLYIARRANPYSPQVSLLDIEGRMGFPRDYLEFTTWYLRNKGYITRADNADFALTAEGVDFVEQQRVNIPILNKLLTSGSPNGVDEAGTPQIPSSTGGPIIVPASSEVGDSIGNDSAGVAPPIIVPAGTAPTNGNGAAEGSLGEHGEQEQSPGAGRSRKRH